MPRETVSEIITFSPSLEIRLARLDSVIILAEEGQLPAVVAKLIEDHGLTLFEHIGSEGVGFDPKTIIALLQEELEVADQARGIVIPIEITDDKQGRKWSHLIEKLAIWSSKVNTEIAFVVGNNTYYEINPRDRLHSMESPLERVPQPENPYAFFYPAAWRAVLDPRAEKPSYSEQLATVHQKLPEMGKLVYIKLTQLIRELGAEGDKKSRLIYGTVMKEMEEVLAAYVLTVGSSESRVRTLTTALSRVISTYPSHIADIFADYTPVFGATNEDEVPIKEANVKGYALMQEWMIGLALKKAEDGRPPFPEARLREEVEKMLEVQSPNNRYR